MTVTGSVVLERALGAIERYGWRRHYLGDTTTGFCAEGAIRFVEGKLRAERPMNQEWYVEINAAGRAARAALLDVIGRDEIPSWNDSRLRKRQVLRAFKRAIQVAQRKEAREHAAAIEASRSVLRQDRKRPFEGVTRAAVGSVPVAGPWPVSDPHDVPLSG